MQDTQINTFTGGLDSDSDLRSVPDSRYIDATNVDTYSVENNSQRSVSPLKGTTLAFGVPSVGSQYQITRVQVDFSANYAYSFSFYDGTSLKSGSFTTTGINPAARYASFQSLLTAQLNSLGYYAATYSANPAYDYVKFTIAKTVSTPQYFRANITWSIGSTEKETVVLQEAYLDNQGLLPIASYTIEDNLFVWSETSNESVIELGVSTVSALGVWTYTRLFRTWRWHFPIINPEAIDIRMESVSNEQWAMYVTDNYNKPKVFYIQKSYSTDCLLKYTDTNWYTATSGYLIYNYADEQTNLQLINNAGVVTFSSQLQTGGYLLSGGYRYSVRFGINGTDNTTEWSVLSPNSIPVFKTNTGAPSAYIRIQGDKSGEQTTKSNVLLVQNCMPNVFNYVELAAIYHAGAATDAKIIGKYPITGSEITITHTGYETGATPYDYRLFPQTEPVIKKAKTLEIKKNRFNIANVNLGADDSTTAALASAASISQGTYSMGGVGYLSSINNTVLNNSATGLVGDTPWYPTPPSFVATTYTLKLSNQSVSNPNYNPTTGIWTVSSLQAGSYNLYFNFSVLVVGSFEANPLLMEIKRKKAASSTFETLVSKEVYYTLGAQLPIQSISVNAELAAGDQVCVTIRSIFRNIVEAYVSSDTNFQAVAIDSKSLDFTGTKVGEYQLPENCANKVGYMFNETYAFFVRFHYKNGYISSPYFVGKRKFFQNQIGGFYDARIYTSGTDKNTYSTLVYHAVINNLDISSIKSQLNGISVWRGVCNPSVLGSGVLFTADDMSGTAFRAGYYASIPTFSGDYYTKYSQTSIQKRFGMFFSHDTRMMSLEPNAGDVVTYFSPSIVLNNISEYKSGSTFQASYAEYFGEVYSSVPDQSDVTVTDGRYVSFDEALGDYNPDSTRILSANGSTNEYYQPSINISIGASGSMENMSLGFNNYVYGQTSFLDNGVYMAQYKRVITGEQYDIKSIDIVPTGTYVSVNDFSPNVLSGINVFGGDTYTQKNILKVRYWSDYKDGTVKSSFISYYAQNKINTQLFYCNQSEDVAPTRNLQGWQSISSYLFPFKTIDEVAEEQFNYDEAYSAQYPLPIKAYDSSVPSESKFVSRIYYSQQKPINSVQDFYRKINALDFRDLDTKNGEIVALRDVNNYMVSVQPRAVSVLPYLSDVAIGTQGGGEILVGTGGVYNQRENIISTYGSTFQTCVYVGQNNNGNSQMYWFSPAFKKYCRYGADGIRILSDEQAMRTYFLGINSVTKEYDMIQVYDPKYASQIMTFKNEASKYTLMYNEKSNNFATFITMNPLRYFLFNNLSMASYISSVYELFTGATLSFFGSSQEFNIKFVANKGVLNDKRFLSTALSVGTGYTFTSPTVAMSVSSHTVFPHLGTLAEKRWDNFFVAFAKAAGQQPIGQFAIIEVKTSAYIELMGAVTKWRGIFRGLFK
jgi:hypothetical protein